MVGFWANRLLDYGATTWFGINPDEFEFQKMPLSTRQEVATYFIAYLCVILGGQWFMKTSVSSPLHLKAIFFLHNAFLSIISALLLAMFLEILVPMLMQHGFVHCVCALELLYYINYLIKYYELLDTVFLVLKKKKLEFLHVYHHAMTMSLCYVELEGQATVSWVPVVLNLMVHVVMYYYYARTAISSKRIWWKKYLTTMQITQFVIDLAVIYVVSWSNLVTTPEEPVRTFRESIVKPALTYTNPETGLEKTIELPHLGECNGSLAAVVAGCFILTSYLALFVQFCVKTYYSKGGEKKGYQKGKGNGVVPDNGVLGNGGVKHLKTKRA
ncbi:hypothetical protein HK102_013293 [Quaeritorhiza haematococci]|nr:hypothetical protein HK102_013293 [Quaeritorhiza haematococci]